MKSPLIPKLLLSGELGINPLLYDSNYPTFELVAEELNYVKDLIRNDEEISKLLDGMSQTIEGVARSGLSGAENRNINVVTTTGNNKCENASIELRNVKK